MRGDWLLWKLRSNGLRILCYHGVCEDRLAGEPWIPSEFVAQSAFEAHLQYLRHSTSVLPLSEAIVRLREGSLPPRSVSLTFDDGYANNLQLAYPVLEKYRTPATIFLSTAYMESGDFFPFLRQRLVGMEGQRTAITSGCSAGQPLLDYKSNPLDLVIDRTDQCWPDVRNRLSEDQERTLRPLTVEEVRRADSQLLEFGAHSHTHCILKNEKPERRQQEIRTSIAKVRLWTGRPARLFSYPNGQRGDFGDADKKVLVSEGILGAVSGIRGVNDGGSDLLELKRYPVGLYHDCAGFSAELVGFRSILLAVSRSLPS